MGVCSCTAKFLLFIFNLICAIVGLLILGISIYLYLQSHTFKDFMHGSVTTTFIVMMVLGGVTFIVAFLGCCGAVNEDPCCISTYATLLTIILVCQLVLAGIFVYLIQGTNLEKDMRKEMEKEFARYNENSKTIDLIQRSLHCCGYDGPQFTVNLPLSCCPPDSIDRFGASVCLLDKAYKDGCANKIINIVTTSGRGGATTLFAIAAVELLCIICAFCVANSIRRGNGMNYSY